MHVVRRCLVIPRHLARIHIDRDQRAGEQIVAFAALACRICRRRIARAENVELRLRIVRARNPRLRAAVTRCVQTRPRVEPRVALLHRHGVELPLQFARLRIEGLQESGRIDIVARAHQDMIADHDRRGRREVALREIGDRLVPALLARLRFERHQVIVRRLHVQIVVPHAQPAIADVRAALRLPEVMPEFAPVARIYRPRVIGHREVQRAVHFQHGGLDRAAANRRGRPCLHRRQ